MSRSIAQPRLSGPRFSTCNLAHDADTAVGHGVAHRRDCGDREPSGRSDRNGRFDTGIRLALWPKLSRPGRPARQPLPRATAPRPHRARGSPWRRSTRRCAPTCCGHLSARWRTPCRDAKGDRRMDSRRSPCGPSWPATTVPGRGRSNDAYFLPDCSSTARTISGPRHARRDIVRRRRPRTARDPHPAIASIRSMSRSAIRPASWSLPCFAATSSPLIVSHRIRIGEPASASADIPWPARPSFFIRPP